MTKEKEVEIDEALQHTHLFFISGENIIMIPFSCYRVVFLIRLKLHKLYLEEHHRKNLHIIARKLIIFQHKIHER